VSTRKKAAAPKEPIAEAPVEPVVESTPEAPAAAVVEAPAKRSNRTSVKSVVFHQVKTASSMGEFLTVTVLGDQTVTLKLDTPMEVATDVADALMSIESPYYVIQSA
jgi:hypothetical protein